jgi:murein DD-endopeptidase MepM/ murein hydrolase activator NlpD
MHHKDTMMRRHGDVGNNVQSKIQNRKSKIPFLLSLCLLCALGVSVVPISAAAPRHRKPKRSAKELRRDLKSVRSQIHEKRAAIHETKKRERRITGEIETVETRLLRVEGDLTRSKARLKALGAQQKFLAARIEATQRRLDARKRLLAQRIRDNYERGRTGYVPVLLQSRSVHDYMSRAYYVERIVDSDVKLVEGIRADQKQLAEDKRRLDAQAEEQKQVRARLEAQTTEYKSEVERKRDLLHEVQESREDMEEALDVLEESSQEIETRLRALQQTPRGRARMQRGFSGRFIRPADGPITSGFGMRFHPILHRDRMHTGIDIGAGYGAAIHAAADGEVVMAGYMRGYGNTVIIDHGGGVSTLYGHCSSIEVSEGQTVRQGDIIARVGSTGLATGPHLHFEVRHNGTPVNPQ